VLFRSDNPYRVSGTLSGNTLGFGGRHTVERAVSNTYTNLTLLDVVLFEAAPGVSVALILLPFALGTRRAWDYVFAALCGGIVAGWFFYIDPYIMYGPRFWYEMMPLLVVLMARGISLLVERGRALARAFGASQLERVPAGLAGLAVAGLLGTSFVAWWGPRSPQRPQLQFVPQNVRDLRGFAFVDTRLLDLVRGHALHHALILVTDECGQCYGSVFPQNDPFLQGDIVYARDRGVETTRALRAIYPDRRFYRATYVSFNGQAELHEYEQ